MTNSSRGSIAIEALILAPVIVVIGTFVVFAGRLTDASGTVHRAADAAARVASQSSSSTAIARAHDAALRSVVAHQSRCVHPKIRVTRNIVQREVHYSVRVTCTVELRGLGLLSVGNRSVSATSSEIVDVYTNR